MCVSITCVCVCPSRVFVCVRERERESVWRGVRVREKPSESFQTTMLDSEQMLLSIEAQLCTRRECKTFRPRRPSSLYVCTAVLQCSTTFVLNL